MKPSVPNTPVSVEQAAQNPATAPKIAPRNSETQTSVTSNEVRMAAEDVDVRHHRQLNHDDEEQQPCGLRYVGRHQGAFGVRLCVISAVTASSAEKST